MRLRYGIPLIFLFFTTLVSGGSIPTLLPDLYKGFAYIGDETAPLGTKVIAKSHETGEVVGRGEVILDTGYYKTIVVFDDALAEGVDEGADVGEALDWYVGDLLASTPAPGTTKARPGVVNGNITIRTGQENLETPRKVLGSKTRSLIFFAGLIMALIFFEAIFISIKRITKG